ncbi:MULTISPECIES: TRAP transporter substrate-binding protein [unclassified Variovorax]|uniref:TRAP transporter substrate-binding protein n=1 Tax=unclassified Variovorax TaxID=663243 RepID=UPI003ECE5380
MKRSIRAVVVGLTVACACVGAAGLAFARDIKERNIKFAFANTADSAHGIGAKRFAEMVASKSGGKLNVKLYGSGTLGGEAVVASAMQGGTIEMSMMGPGLLTGMDKEFGVFDTPFLFDSFKEVDAALDGPVGKKLLDKLPAKGLVGLSYWDHGFRILTNSKRPIAKLEDIQGLKIRVQQIPVFIESFNAMGANAVPMPFPELYSALEQKAVDGQENPFISVEVTKFYEVQKYASTTRHAYSPLLVLMSKKFWDQLSADERKVLTDAANEVKSYERQVSRELDAKALDTLKSRGMVITEVSAQERARMRDKLKPVIDKHRQTTGELGKEMTAEVERIRSGK